MIKEKTNNINAVYTALFIIIVAGFFLVSLNQNITTPITPSTELKKFSSLAELKDFIKSNQQAGDIYAGRAPATTDAGAPVQAGAESKAAADDYSTTNIQVAGVDEADIVKNDGKYVYTITGSNVVITDAYPAENAGIVSTINMSGSSIHGLYVKDNKLVVFTSVYRNYYDYYTKPLASPQELSIASPTIVRPYFSSTILKVYDISDRSNPVMKKELTLNGTYYNSRMIGSSVYAIVNSPIEYYKDDIVLPMEFRDIYYFDYPDYSYQLTSIVSINVDDDSEPQSKVFLLGYSNVMFVSKDNIYLTYQKRVKPSILQDRITEEVILPLVPEDVASKIRQIMQSDKTYYEKESELAEAVQGWFESLGHERAAEVATAWQEKAAKIQIEIAKETDKSVIHKISISNGEIVYRTHGEVPGQPLNQFSMDEHNGYFRIATTTNPNFFEPMPLAAVEPAVGSGSAGSAESGLTTVIAPPPPPRSSRNHIYVLDSEMKVVGKVEDLAPGERIFSARFIGNKAYLVTFVSIDPLFVVDLSDPTNPKVLGELKISGVSDYLHPYDENHIIGVGQATEEVYGRVTFSRLKLSLFDVSDVSNPKELAKYVIGNSGTRSDALYDHKAFLFSKDRSLLVLPVLLTEKDYQYAWQGVFVFNLDLQDGFVLKGRITHENQIEKSEFYYPAYPVRRSLYIGNMLYTVSDAAIKANSLPELSEIARIDLPVERQIYYPR